MLRASIRGVGMAAVAITRTELGVSDLRAAAKRLMDGRQSRRVLAIAMVLDGYSREAAAQACGMDRQTLRDWIYRYNEANLDGLSDRARCGRPACLSKAEQATVAAWVDAGADLSRDGVVRFRRADLRDRIATAFAVYLHERSIGKLLAELGYRRLSVRPHHPQTDLAAQESFKKLRRPGARGARRTNRAPAGRGLVPGRGACRPARHPDPHLGQAWQPSARAA